MSDRGLIAEPEGILSGALLWLMRNRQFFDPFRRGTLTGLNEVPLSELAILTLSLLRVPEANPPPGVVASFLDVLEAAYVEPIFRQRPFREPESLVSHLIVTVALERGDRIEAAEEKERLAELIRRSNLTVPSLPPHRLMELRHAVDLAGMPVGMPWYTALYDRSAAAGPINPVFMSRAENYIVTHIVFYATDLGFEVPRGIDAAALNQLTALVHRLLGMSIVARDWDLTAEFLLCVLALAAPSAFVNVAWDCLTRAQHDDGAVLGLRAGSTSGPAKIDDEDEVATRYHTTLVSALAALTAIHKRTERAFEQDHPRASQRRGFRQ